MSDDEDYTDEESFGDSGSDSGSDSSSDSFSSFNAAFAAIAHEMERMTDEVETIHSCMSNMDAPVAHVAVGTFVNPRVLESAPFRSEQFRVKREARHMFGISKHVAHFSELCAAIRASGRPLLDTLLDVEEILE